MNFTRIAIVDDKQANRVSLNERVSSAHDCEVIFTAVNGDDFLEKMKNCPADSRPELVLMDIDMPIMDGIEAVKRANQLYTSVKFLMVTIFDDDEKIFEAIKAGASGYLLKDESGAVISNAIKEVLEFGGVPMSPKIARKAMNLLMNAQVENKKIDKEEFQLSSREMDILKLMVEGCDYKQVADRLSISPHTVRKHIANIYEKLHVCSKVEAVKIALKKGWFNSFLSI
ncbi:MAG: response regulator transcription factor [Bacteroidia bacterium]|nr:response regulator transcription factor [Bacteroidia bacterium]